MEGLDRLSVLPLLSLFFLVKKEKKKQKKKTQLGGDIENGVPGRRKWAMCLKI